MDLPSPATVIDSAAVAAVAAVVLYVSGYFLKSRVARAIILAGFLCALLVGYAVAYLSSESTPWPPRSILRTFPQEWQCRFFLQAAQVEATATQCYVYLRRDGADQEKPRYGAAPSHAAGIFFSNWIVLILLAVGGVVLTGIPVILAILFVRRFRCACAKCPAAAAEESPLTPKHTAQGG